MRAQKYCFSCFPRQGACIGRGAIRAYGIQPADRWCEYPIPIADFRQSEPSSALDLLHTIRLDSAKRLTPEPFALQSP